MTPSRVVIINDRSAAIGGATNLALLSARLLSEAGIPVTYVTGDTGERANLPDAVNLVPLGGAAMLEQPMGQRIAGGLYNMGARRLLQTVIDKLDAPDVVYHIHGWAQTLSPAAFHALRPVESRLLVHSHDFTMVCPNGSYYNFQTDTVCKLKPLSTACLSAHCDKRRRADKAFRSTRTWLKHRLFDVSRTKALIATIHPSMNPWLVRGGASPDRIRTVRNPVAAFTRTRVAAEDKEDLFFIGRVQSEKGVDLAAKAADAVGRRLRVIGDGPERERLAAAFPNIKWEGWRTHDEIRTLITEARGLIMPSRLPEPFGLVALEALQSGVPLVAYGDAFVAREAADRQAAFVAETRDDAALIAAAAQLDDDTTVSKASHIGFNDCADLSNTHESWRDQLIELYGELLRTSQPIVA